MPVCMTGDGLKHSDLVYKNVCGLLFSPVLSCIVLSEPVPLPLTAAQCTRKARRRRLHKVAASGQGVAVAQLLCQGQPLPLAF